MTGRAGAVRAKGVSDMATDTQTATALIDEATAIVEAEWMRLQQEEEDLWCEVADLFAEMPAPRPRPPRTGVTVQLQRPSRPLPPAPVSVSVRKLPT